METQARYVLIGIFTLLTAVLALSFALWTAKHQSSQAWNDFEILFSSAVTGLSVGSPVRFNGIPVGTVEGMRINPADPREVIVRIRVAANAPVKTDTEVRLVPSGLTGLTFVQLSGGSPDSPLVIAVAETDPPQIHADSSALERLLAFSEEIATQGHEVLTHILAILSPENAQQISNILHNLSMITSALHSEEEHITGMIGSSYQAMQRFNDLLLHADQVVFAINQSIKRLDQDLVAAVPSIASNLQDSSRRLAILLHRIDGIIEENEVVLTSVGNEVLAQLGPTIGEFRLLIRDLQRLSGRLEHNPTGFLLGREPVQEFKP